MPRLERLSSYQAHIRRTQCVPRPHNFFKVARRFKFFARDGSPLALTLIANYSLFPTAFTAPASH